MKCAAKMDSGDKICIPGYMKIGIDVQAILRFCLRNFTGCNIGIAHEKD
jgi:hypothetical protein